MSATVHDLLTRREYQRRQGMYFDSPIDALRFLEGRLVALGQLGTGVLLVDALEVTRQVNQLAAITRACVDAHHQTPAGKDSDATP